MRNKNLLIMSVAASTFLLASCFESEAQNSAQTTQSLTGIYCQKADDKNTSFAAIQDTDVLRFSISVWNNASGHDCGIVNATANNDGNGSWVYQNNQNGNQCSISFTAQDDGTLSIIQNDDCRAMCGMSADIGEVNLPAASKITADVSDTDLTGLYETPVCP